MNLSAELIQRHWGLRDSIIVPIKETAWRSVYRVESKDGRFVFKSSSPERGKYGLENDVATLLFLERHGFSSPRVLKTASREFIVKVGDRFVYAMYLVEGRRPRPTATNFRKLGGLAARLHTIREPYDRECHMYPTREVERMHLKAKKFNMDPKYLELVSVLPCFDNLSTSMIHSDIGLYNAIEKPNGELVLIDFDGSGLGVTAMDIAYPLKNAVRWRYRFKLLSNQKFRFFKKDVQAFLKGYSSVRVITREERKNLYDFVLFYGLAYSVLENSGIQEEAWGRAQFIAENRDLFENFIESFFSGS